MTKRAQSRVIYPLGTNIDWFQTAEQKLSLEQNIKQNILFYDELFFEPGTLTMTIVEGPYGGRSGMWSPWSEKIEDFDFVRSSPVGKQFVSALQTRAGTYIPAMHGTVEAHYKADYRRILQDIHSDIGKNDFIKVLDTWTPDSEQKQLISALTSRDRNDPRVSGVLKQLPGGQWLESATIEEINKNLVLSRGIPIVCDSIHIDVFQRKSQCDPAVKLDLGPLTLGSILELEVPRFGENSWGDIVRLRREESLKSFRSLLRDLSSALDGGQAQLNPAEACERVKRAYTDRMRTEMERLSDTSDQVVLKIFLGVIGTLASPQIGGALTAVAAILEIYKLFRARTNWCAFIAKLKND